MQIPTFEREENLVREGRLPVGVDEAGRGPLAGPVVAAAVMLRNFPLSISNCQTEEDKRWKLVRDSKKLSPKQREAAFNFVQEQFFVGIGIIGPETIDRVNILQATFLAMKAALADLRRITKHELRVTEKLVGQYNNATIQPLNHVAMKPWYILIDGNQIIPNLTHEQEPIVNGDGLVRSIAAASIVAKVTRDRIITEADALYPGYGLALHKGYGTAVHMAALRKLGPSPIHRMSFRPVQLAIPENVNRRFANVLKPKK